MRGRELSVPTAAQAAILLKVFRDATFDEASIHERIGVIHSALERRSERASRLGLVPPTSVFNLLVRWFVLSESVERSAADRLVESQFLDAAIGLGLLTETGSSLEAAVLVIPQGELLIAGDRYDIPAELVPEPVLPVNAPARTLLGFTLQSPVNSLLDLCCGGGVQALAAASRARSVVATDLNARAVTFARLNARLNGFDHVECLAGDRFEPVTGRKFDQIVCNPPFVISPSKRFLYSDNESPLDDFCRSLIEEAPEYLEEEGVFQMILEWVQFEGRDWQSRLAKWVEGSGCDAWFLSFNLMLPETNAEVHAATMAAQSPVDELALREELAGYLREQGVEAVHGGFVMLRRRSGDNWLSFSEIRGRLPGDPQPEWIEDGFRARDFLRSRPDQLDLLSARPRLRRGVTFDQSTEWNGRAWQKTPIRLRATRGLPCSLELDENVVEFVSHCSGRRSVAELCRRLQAKTGEPQADVERECCSLVRRLIELGVLEAVNDSDSVGAES